MTYINPSDMVNFMSATFANQKIWSRGFDILEKISKYYPFLDSGICFYCGVTSLPHAEDCPYLLIQQLLEELDD